MEGVGQSHWVVEEGVGHPVGGEGVEERRGGEGAGEALLLGEEEEGAGLRGVQEVVEVLLQQSAELAEVSGSPHRLQPGDQ